MSRFASGLKNALRSRLAVCLLIAAAVRVLWIALCPNEPVSDQVVYHVAARNIVNGLGFAHANGDPIGYWPMGYSGALAGVYALFGAHFASAFGFNLLLGLITVWATYWLAELLYGERVATAAGVAMALYPGLVMYVTVIGSENLYIPLSILAVALAVKAQHEGGGLRELFGVGLVAGLATLVRPNSAVFPILVFCAALLFGRGLASGAKQAALVLAIVMAVALPYGLRNQRVFGAFSITPFNGGVLLYVGNHPEADGQNPEDETLRRRGIWGEGKPAAAFDREMKQRAIEYITRHPLRFVQLVAQRAYHTVKAEAVGVGWNAIGIEKRFGERAISVLKVLATGAWYALMFGFLLALAQKIRRREFGRAEALLLVAIGIGSLPFLVVLGMDRYHMPLVPLLIVMAATLLAESGLRSGAQLISRNHE